MNEENVFCYVAADPAQPGAAWAAAVDLPKYAKDTAKEIAKWVKEGAHVQRVPLDQAREMLGKWVKPMKPMAGDLFTPPSAPYPAAK